jgi:hypothetical protein
MVSTSNIPFIATSKLFSKQGFGFHELKYPLWRDAIFSGKVADGYALTISLSDNLVALLGAKMRGKVLLVVDGKEEEFLALLKPPYSRYVPVGEAPLGSI